MKKRLITRRDFFRATAGMAIAAALGPESANLAEARAKESQARVVLIRDPQVFDRDGKIRGVVLQKMLDEGLKALTEEADSLRAWKKRFRKEDIVGIKSNAWGKMPTPEPLESAIRQRLLDVGIEEKNISIDDRGVLENPVFFTGDGFGQCPSAPDAFLVGDRRVPQELHHVCAQPFGLSWRGLCRFGEDLDRSPGPGKNPSQSPQRPHPAILRPGPAFFRSAVCLAVRRNSPGNRPRGVGCRRGAIASAEADRPFWRRSGIGCSTHPYLRGREKISTRGQ
jgi:hypothetical protein